MSDVTQILSQIESGNRSAAEQLLPLVYEELRRLAAAKMAQEAPGQTLQATALVHEAYLRLVDVDKAQHWNSRGHFFGAAAEAMRRILVERARQKQRVKHGGEQDQQSLPDLDTFADDRAEDILRVDEALQLLADEDPLTADLVKLRFFVGLSLAEAAEAMDISRRSVDRIWSYA
ncbi:MAG: ECF-type sigma factor, partial [Planctomycetes bacterium]|nr:ECF-type sigma factor [Planctomycetota bacterium]